MVKFSEVAPTLTFCVDSDEAVALADTCARKVSGSIAKGGTDDDL